MVDIDAFKIVDNNSPKEFAQSWLASPDFTLTMLQEIGSHLSIPMNSKRPQIIEKISLLSDKIGVQNLIIKSLILRSRKWVTFKRSDIIVNSKDLQDANNLVQNTGESQWYGSIQLEEDPQAKWYIRPVFIDHQFLQDGHSEPTKCKVRWLVFARIHEKFVSLHWNGFSHNEDEPELSNNQHNSQLAYWKYIPELFSEFQRKTGSVLRDIDLHDLILNKLWDTYRRNKLYKWTDRKVRAEANGVFLNARSGGLLELTIDNKEKGLGSLSTSIWKSIETEFKVKYPKLDIPEQNEFSDIILGTIIRGLGAISYEFGLQSSDIDSEKIIRANCYFGSKPNDEGPDKFPHVRLYISQLNVLQQLQFLFQHIGNSHVKSQPKQIALL